MDARQELLEDAAAYDAYIAQMREVEYPMLQDGSLYLDHAGTTPPSKRLLDRFHADVLGTLYGNPHSASPSSQRAAHAVEDARLALLRFLRADSEHFDLVFTANATAGVKLVAEAFREGDGFEYAYHVDSHTSLVGVRELASRHVCLESDREVESWIDCAADYGGESAPPRLLAYPAQSNMNGWRLPLEWCARARRAPPMSRVYTLLDAAAYASTSPTDFSDAAAAPDFTVFSLYKIFGFPDLGALLINKRSGQVLQRRKYFGGGTVDMVVCRQEQWHAKRSATLHEQLEDGTLPVHSILALKSAIPTHAELFGSLERISTHTAALAQQLHDGLQSLKHFDDTPVCAIYDDEPSRDMGNRGFGPVVAFNLRQSRGQGWISNTEVEKLAAVHNIHLRTGGVCNPGGIATALDLQPWEMRENFSAGNRCGGENDIWNDKPTGVIRVSLGAMSTRSDVDRFIAFVDEFFVETSEPIAPTLLTQRFDQRFYVESLAVYPIKSCGSWQIPYDQSWDIRPEGLAWDREWCVVHQGTGRALSQKQHPRMALLRPRLDFGAGVLRVSVVGGRDEMSVPLSRNPALYTSSTRNCTASVCGDAIEALTYISPDIAAFFTKAIDVPCTLARFRPGPTASRHSKPHLTERGKQTPGRPLQLSNESPILTISRSSLNRLNEQVKARGGKAVHHSVFRANIVLAEDPLLSPGQEQPWAEDTWDAMHVRGAEGPLLEFLGGCRRCQMVCVDQQSAEKSAEPFVTLAKTRRFEGRVLFGVHTALATDVERRYASIKVGDAVETIGRGEQ